MDDKTRAELRAALGALHVDAAPFTDCLWVILAEYFEDHPSCPETDPDPDEFGFGEWVMHEADRALDVIIDFIEKHEAALHTALAAATEREAYLAQRLQYESEAHAASRRALRSAEGCERLFKEAADAAESKLARACGCEHDGTGIVVQCEYHAEAQAMEQAALAARLAEVEDREHPL